MNTEQIITDSRASAILYRFLNTFDIRKKILLPVNICSIVPAVVQKAGFEPEYVDINMNDLCADEESIIQKIGKNPQQYSGIIYNYTYGITTNKEAFFNLIKANYNLWIIEDKCSCYPDLSHSKAVDMTLFSTGYAKQVDLGFGGYGIFNIPFTEGNKKKIILEVSPDKTYVFGVNDFQLSLNEYFEQIHVVGEKTIKHKKVLNEIYKELLPKQIQLSSDYNNWRFNILVKNKNEILKNIFKNNLFASDHFKCMNQDTDLFQNALNLHKMIINLFNDLYFNEEQTIRICKIINQSL